MLGEHEKACKSRAVRRVIYKYGLLLLCTNYKDESAQKWTRLFYFFIDQILYSLKSHQMTQRNQSETTIYFDRKHVACVASHRTNEIERKFLFFTKAFSKL